MVVVVDVDITTDTIEVDMHHITHEEVDGEDIMHLINLDMFEFGLIAIIK